MNTRSAISVGFAVKIVLTLSLFTLTVVPVAHGQLVADGASATLNNVTNSFTGNVIVGTNGSFTRLTLTNGALLTNTLNGFIGLNSTAKSNTVSLTGTGTRWLLGQDLCVGTNGSFNLLVISNGAVATCRLRYIGFDATASNNVVVVTGTNSSLNSINTYVGIAGSGNQLVISNGGQVTNSNGQIGNTSSNNLVMVTDPGSRWANSALIVGLVRNGNHLIVSNGATVSSPGYVSVSWELQPSSMNNRLTVDGGNLLVTNNAGNGQLRIINGTNVLNDGLIVADSLLLNYNGGRFEFNGGTLITRSGSISNGQNFAVGRNAGYPAATWVVLSNATPTTIHGDLLIGESGGARNSVHVNGGTLLVGGSLDARRGTIQLNSGTVSANSLLAANGTNCSVLFNGGTLSVSNSTVNTGQPFLVGKDGSSTAIYQLTGSGLHTFNNGLVLAINGELRGNGTVSGNLTAPVYSAIYPGNYLSIGRLVLSNSPSLGAALIMDISKNGASLTNDQIQVAAPLTYGGSLYVNKLGPTPLVNGDSFKLFNASSYAGVFNPLALPILPAGLMWTNRLLVNGTIAVVPQTVPKITTVTRSDTNLIMNVTGGPPGFEATLHTATNVALPIASWQDIGVYHFDWFGNLTLTKGINFGEPQRYFRIMVGANN